MITSTEKRAQIVVLREEGYTQRENSRKVEVLLSTVNEILQHVKKFGVTTPNKSPGRRRITSKQTDNAIKRAAIKNPFASSGQIAAELSPTSNVSKRTIRRLLANEFGLRARRAVVKPLMSKKNIADRMRFCKLHRNWTAAD